MYYYEAMMFTNNMGKQLYKMITIKKDIKLYTLQLLCKIGKN